MYSYEDRIRAVTLYIKLGKRTGATIRQLGYPTKNSLRSWHEEYERRLDLSSGYVRSKPKYSQIQKEQAVKHYAEHGRCIASTVKALGYPCRDLLRAWIHELDPDSRQRVVGRAVSAPRPPQLKKLAVLDLCTREGSAQVVAQKLGVSRPTLYNWKNQLLGREAPASMKHTNQSPRAQERI
jgi:transposase-like protein